MKKGLLACVMTLVILALPLGTAMAMDGPIQTERSVYEGETFQKLTVITGGNLRVMDCTFNGTTIVMGNNINFSGQVDGNLVVLGNSIQIEGRVTGSVFAAGQGIDLAAEVAQEVYAAGQTFRLADGGRVGRDAVIGASNVTLDGTVGRDAYIGCNAANLLGSIGGDATLGVGHLELTEGTQIGGNVTYYSDEEIAINGNAGIRDRAQWVRTARLPREASIGARVAQQLMGLGAGLVFAIALYGLAMLVRRGGRLGSGEIVRRNTLRTFLIGLGCAVFVPICAVLSMFTIIGIATSFFALVIWGMMMVCTSAVSAYVGMDLLADRLRLNTAFKRFVGYVVLVLALHLAMTIPYVGTIVRVASCFLGMGVLFSVAFLRPRGDAGHLKGADAGVV